jgi:hypothetical protein
MPHVPSTDPEAVIAILIGTFFCLTHWRIVLRIILFLVIALAIIGVVAGLHGATSLMAQHHR